MHVRTRKTGGKIVLKMSVCVESQHVESLQEPSTKRSRLDEHVTALRVKRLSEHAVLPSRSSPHAAGYDLYR